MRLLEWVGTGFVWVPGTPPANRGDDFEIVWDAGRNVLVMFGGGRFFSDTWEWDGAVWVQRGAGGPPGRRGHKMVYDAARQRVVLFGGTPMAGGGSLSDTWEWDGQVWRERFGIAPDLQGEDSAHAYDSTLGRMVLYGGTTTTNQPTNAVWTFDGNVWSRLPTSGGPYQMQYASMVYDVGRQRMLRFGGYSTSVSRPAELFEMTIRNAHTATFTAHGAGCAGSLSTPTLLPRANSRPLLGAEFQLQFANLPSSPISSVFACLGVDDQTWNGIPLPFDASSLGLPGCSLRLAPAIVVPLSNQGGFADWNLPIPASPVLDGSTFFVQGIVVAPGANAGGALLSDSGRGLLGLL